MRPVAAALCALAALAGCGGEAEGQGERPQLVVSAAASLKTALTAYAGDFGAARVRLQFAGSDELAAQIRRGVRPGVFAAANTALPEQLFAEGLVERPVTFAQNELVLAVPAAGGAKVRSLDDLTRDGVTIAIGDADVPVGAYTRALLGRLGPGERRAILANVRSEEPDAAGIAGKLRQGAVDAGFLYASDVRASGGALEAIALPARLRPAVAYAAAVVKGAARPREARAFVEGLVRGAGARALEEAGFRPPPGS